MEKVRSLLKVLDSFAEAVVQVKQLLSEIETEIKEQTRNLKNYLESLEDESARKAITEADSRSTPLLEHELDEKISDIKKEIELLEKMKQMKINQNDYVDYNSGSEVYDLSFESAEEDEAEYALYRENEYAMLTEAPAMISRDSMRYSTAGSIAGNDPIEDFLKWQRIDQSEGEDVDPDKEQLERKRMKLCLAVTNGSNVKYKSCKEIHIALKKWTLPKRISWTVERNQYDQPDNTPVVYARFKMYNDRQKVIDLWEKTNEFDGQLHVSKALTAIETKERKRMLDMTHELRKKGHNVVFEDKSICIDGQWWKYFWGEGWRKV